MGGDRKWELTGREIWDNFPNMETKIAKAISAAVTNILRPLVRLLLRNGIPYRTFSDIAKRVYVDVATEEFCIPGRKQSKSRVSILTGLSRKEVLRVRRLPAPDDLGAGRRYNRAARVIAGWVRDRRFRDDSGNPAELAVRGGCRVLPGPRQDLQRGCPCPGGARRIAASGDRPTDTGREDPAARAVVHPEDRAKSTRSAFSASTRRT